MVKEKDEKLENQVGRRDILTKIASAVFASLVAPAVLSDTAQAVAGQQTTQQTPTLPELPHLSPTKTQILLSIHRLFGATH